MPSSLIAKHGMLGNRLETDYGRTPHLQKVFPKMHIKYVVNAIHRQNTAEDLGFKRLKLMIICLGVC